MDLSEIKKEYSKAQTQATQFAPTFRKYQQLAANTVDELSENNPFPYGEGTAASIIRKLPQRVLRQMPVGRLRNLTDEFMAVVNEYIVEEIFVRNACRENGLIQTLWSVMENGMVFGWSTVTPFFTKVNGAYTIDFRSHYWADVMPAPGVTNMNKGNVFIRDWWSVDDAKALLELAKEDKTLDKNEIKALLGEELGSRESGNQSETNRAASVSNLGLEVIRYYVLENGKYMLYIFRPQGEKPLQKKELSCRGHVTFYYSPDFLTAYGRSILGLIGGIQVDMDNTMRSKRKAEKLEIDPMLVVEGMPLGEVQVKSHTMIRLPVGGKIYPFEMNTPSLEKYHQNHSADQALIYQLAGYPEANVSSSSGGAWELGKTPTAIKQAERNVDNADNQVSYNLKQFLELLYVDSLKMYYSNLPEQFMVELSQEYATRLYPIAPDKFVAPRVVMVENNLDMFDYEIDIESGKNDANQQKLDAVGKMMAMLEGSELIAQRAMQLGIIDDIIKEIVFATGLNNDSIARKLSFLDNPNISNQTMAPPQMQPALPPGGQGAPQQGVQG